MEKVKIFSSSNSFELEKNINDWLEEMRKNLEGAGRSLEITRVVQSSFVSNIINQVTIVSIFYKTRLESRKNTC